MSADMLREAAELMREQHGPDHPRHEMWAAMAGLLDNAAEDHELLSPNGGELGPEHDTFMRRYAHTRAVNVARTYLAADPSP